MSRLTLSFDQRLIDDVRKQSADIINDELGSLTARLKQEFPRGVSSGESSLSGSLQFRPANASAPSITAKVESPLPFSVERLAGRGPGKPPPISAVERWALSKGISPYAVARKIGEQGTNRWQEGESANVLRIDPRSKVIPTDKGLQKDATDRIVRRIEGIRF